MKRESTFKIIAIVVGITFSLLIGELISRVYYFGPDGLSFKKVNSYVPLGFSGFVQSADDKKILYELKPNIDAYFKLKTFKTNSQNFRDKEYRLSKPKKTIRGINIGDSFTMGSGVTIDEVYHSVIEQKLNDRKDGHNYEVLNFGVGGYNLLNYLAVAKSKALKYNPDFIILGFCGENDFMLPNENYLEGKFNPKKRKSKQSYLWMLVDAKLSAFRKKKTPGTLPKINEAELAFVEKSFKEFEVYSQANNIPIFINYLSIKNKIENLEIVKNLAVKHNLHFIDSNGKFDIDNPEKYYIIENLDAHPNPEANSIFANSMLMYAPFMEILQEPQNPLPK